MIIMGGINDLTIRSPETGRVSLKFATPMIYVDHIMSIINSTRVLVGNEFPNTLQSFAGIIGMDLNKYNRLSGAADCQSSIDTAILEVNRRIAHSNQTAGSPTRTLLQKSTSGLMEPACTTTVSYMMGFIRMTLC